MFCVGCGSSSEIINLDKVHMAGRRSDEHSPSDGGKMSQGSKMQFGAYKELYGKIGDMSPTSYIWFTLSELHDMFQTKEFLLDYITNSRSEQIAKRIARKYSFFLVISMQFCYVNFNLIKYNISQIINL